jgi:hypothetical protein
MAPMLARALGALYFLSLIGAGLYSLVAMLFGWPPAQWFIDLAVLLDGSGSYSVIEVFAATWFHLLVLLVAPPAVLALVETLRTTRAKPALEGAAAERFRALSRTRLAIGVAICAGVAIFYPLIVHWPELLAANMFVALGARLGIVLAPFGIFGGPAAVLDALLAPTMETVVVSTVTDAPGRRGEFKQINGLFEVDAHVARELRVGAEVSVFSTRVFRSVLSLTKLDPYR